MNKKLIFIIVAVLAIGAALGFWLKSKDASEDDGHSATQVDTANTWNPYADDKSTLHTLSDFVISANNGNYIMKMTVTLDFDSEESYLKFQGHTDMEGSEEEEDGHGSSEEGVLTPMEYVVNDTIGDLMMQASEDVLLNKDKLKQYLLDGINKSIEVEPKLLKELYIENYVIQ